MIATIRHAIRAAVDFAHNLYAQLPAPAQTFLTLAVFGLFAAAQGFNWTIPTTGAQFNAELAALAALAYGIVVPLFQTYILPKPAGLADRGPADHPGGQDDIPVPHCPSLR